jgi:hypothetical protein
MRFNKEIAKLTEMSKGVEWPKPPHHTFTHFENQLREVLRANNIPCKGMDFDEYNGHFYWVENFSFKPAGHPGSFETTFHIDPKLSIEDEIYRILKERQEIEEVSIEMARAQYAKEQADKAKNPSPASTL